MAAANTQSVAKEAVQCMICMEYDGFLKCDIKRMPCSHVLCTECIINLSEVSTEQHDCTTCRSVLAENVDNLPSASKTDQRKEKIIPCHICERKKEKGDETTPADMYCYDCDNVYCDEHSGPHFVIHPDHKAVEIAVYKRNVKWLEKRYCSVHKDRELTVGCPGCYQIFCMKCLPKTKQCKADGAHEFTAIDDLKSSLTQELDKLRVEAQQRESEADKLVKDTMIALENWDRKTEELVSQLQKTRDEHIQGVRNEYARLEIELEKHRSQGRIELELFLEKTAEQKHVEIVRKLKYNDDRMSSYHKTEFIEKYNESVTYLRGLTEGGLPASLSLENDVAAMEVRGKKETRMDLQITAVSGDETFLGGQSFQTTSTQTPTKLPPTGLKLIQELKTDKFCFTVCHYNGYTYVGQSGGAIDRVDQQGHIEKAFIKLDFNVASLAAHNGMMYSLRCISENQSKIHIHNIHERKLIGSWDHPGFKFLGQRVILVGNDVFCVGDWPSKQLIIYSGRFYRKVPCPPPLTMTGYVSMCSCAENSVVISDSGSAKVVVRMSLKDGRFLWSSDSINEPGGIFYHPAGYVFVVSSNISPTTISVLDETDGNVLLCMNNNQAISGYPNLYLYYLM